MIRPATDPARSAVPETGLRDRVVPPALLVAGLGVLAILAVALYLAGVPRERAEQVVAAGLLLFALGAVAQSPVNGLALLFLLPPLFNGEDDRPYFFLIELVVYPTLLAGVAARLVRRRAWLVPPAPALLFFLACTALAVPLSLRELGLELRVLSWRDIVEGIRRSELQANLYYVRTVLNVASGVGLTLLAAGERWSREAVSRLALGVTALCAAVTGVGLYLAAFPVPGPHGGTAFLTVYLSGSGMGGFLGLGFNQSYYGQYAVAYLPLVVLVLVEHPSRWVKALAATTLLAVTYAVVVTYQRGAWLALLIEFGLLVLAGRCLGMGAAAVRLAAAAAASVLLALAAVLALTPVGGLALERVVALWQGGDPIRRNLLEATRAMVGSHPLLGVGSGRFAHAFQFYSSQPTIQIGHWSAHNLYAQILAEQGVLGLLAFSGVLVAVLGRLLRRWGRMGEERTPAAFLLISMGAWLAYGGLQYTLLMRSMQLYFWIALGLLIALTPEAAQPSRPGRRWKLGAAGVLLLAFALRLHAVRAMPAPFTTERYVLAPPRGAAAAAIVSPRTGESIPVVPGILDGWVDGWGLTRGRAVLNGWAMDLARKEAPAMILVFADGRLFSLRVINSPRLDVTVHFQDTRFGWSGFRYPLSAALFLAPGAREVRVFAVSDRGVASELRYAPGYRWGPPS